MIQTHRQGGGSQKRKMNSVFYHLRFLHLIITEHVMLKLKYIWSYCTGIFYSENHLSQFMWFEWDNFKFHRRKNSLLSSEHRFLVSCDWKSLNWLDKRLRLLFISLVDQMFKFEYFSLNFGVFLHFILKPEPKYKYNQKGKISFF